MHGELPWSPDQPGFALSLPVSLTGSDLRPILCKDCQVRGRLPPTDLIYCTIELLRMKSANDFDYWSYVLATGSKAIGIAPPSFNPPRWRVLSWSLGLENLLTDTVLVSVCESEYTASMQQGLTAKLKLHADQDQFQVLRTRYMAYRDIFLH